MRIATTSWVPEPGAAQAVALEVLLHGPISRSEIARRLDLSAGSLTRLSTPLINSGLLVEVDESSAGRPDRRSRPLDIVPDSQHFVGLKVTGDAVLGAVTDLRAQVVATTAARLDSRAPEAVARVIADVSRELAGRVPSVTAIGVGIGGRVDRDSVVRSAPFLEWEDVALAAMIEAELNVPTVVDNDVVAFTEAEHWFGAGRGLQRFAVITIGAGIGYGLVAHDRIVISDDSGLGLVGHWPVDPFGPLCPAGHRGCARSMLTNTAIAQAASLAIGHTIDYDETLDLAEHGEPAARRVVDDAGRGLGRLFAAVGNLTVPERIVVGGEGVRLVDVAADAVREGIRIDRDPRSADLDLVTTPGDDTEWCRGAAVLAIQRFVVGARS
jgi:predicted NBD/HSP70 family sugar kinase